MESLLRTKVAQFTLEDALRLEEIEKQVQTLRQQGVEELTTELLEGVVARTDTVFEEYPGLSAREGFEKMLYNGNAMQPEWIEGWEDSLREKKIRLYDQKERFIGIYQYSSKYKDIRPIKIFME